jgi:hypothetical protein
MLLPTHPAEVLFSHINSAPVTSHLPASSIFLSQQISTSHPPPANRTRQWVGGTEAGGKVGGRQGGGYEAGGLRITKGERERPRKERNRERKEKAVWASMSLP